MANNASNYSNSFLTTNTSSGEVSTNYQLMTNVMIMKTAVVVFISLSFIYLNAVMFYSIRSNHVIKETPRYILFAHMLLNDSIQILITVMLFIWSVLLVKLITVACVFVIFVSCVTFRNAPLNLAVMSLERYVAICFPLRHAQLATQKRTSVAIGIIWFIGSINFVVDVFYTAATGANFFTSQIYCTRDMLFSGPWQVDVLQGFNTFHFVAVALIIVFTYISIMIVARTVSGKKDSAKKAHRTVLLHFIQLGLCLCSSLYSTIERALIGINTANLRYVNYLIFLILPRCLSPFIYGLRDEAIRPLFKYYFLWGTGKVKPLVSLH